MSEENLSDLLERAADAHAVGVPPLDQMLVRSRRARRGRAGLLAVAASVVVGSVIAGTTLLVGHDDSRRSSPANTPPSKQIILDGEWRVVALQDEEGKSLLRSDKVQLIFKAGKVGGSTECNSFGGPYRQSGPDGQDLFIPNRIDSTLVGCNETPIGLRLPAVRHATESGGVLFLQSESRTNIATLVRIGQPIVLDGEWKVTSLFDTEGKSVLTERLAEHARILFNNGRLLGHDECNDFEGRYEQGGSDGQDNTITNIHGTQVGCSDDLVVGLLAVRHATESDESLQLRDENWATIATLERSGPAHPGLQPGQHYATSNFPRNEFGQTYGSDALAENFADTPDLIAVYGINGRVGFIKKTDSWPILHPNFKSPADAAAYNEEQRKNPPPAIPVYDLDGKTQIDTFRYGVGSFEARDRDGNVTQRLPEGN